MKEFLPKSAAKMADCLMKRYGLLTSRWSYDYGVAWRGMEALYAMTGEKKYFDYIKDAMDTFVTDESGAIRDYTLDEFNLDYICNGRQAAPLKSLQIHVKSSFVRWLDYTNFDYTICAA